ncbi:MAG: HPF/RaiA family ribosome-associated protein, partial [Candidatus Omnitrophica bacterium]|nr:HPF/RaiA family ribosome-associated protein [Candidatus Omnitrophota bacterium]
MRIDVSFKYLEKSDFIDNILEGNFRKIERRLKMFRRQDPVHISVHLEKNPHKEQYFCRSHVYLPSSKVVAADENGRNISLAVNKAFSAISKQLDKEKHKWEKQRRQSRQKRLKN